MKNLLPANTVPEFHHFQRLCFDWHLVFYCHNGDASFSSQHESAFTQREGLARDFMNRLQRRLGLRQKEMAFFAATEFGKTGRGHLHILISLDGLRQKNRMEKLAICAASFSRAVEIVHAEMLPKSIKVECESVLSDAKNQKKMLSYVCKIEQGRDYKHCFNSRRLNNNTF